MKINFDHRTIYASLRIDNETGKKKTYFGKKGWGSLSKNEANTIAYKTGDGLVVVDIDTQDLKLIDKNLRNILKEFTPTVTTARGYHYYFKDKKSSEFINKSAYSNLVDVRSDGGIIFAQYIGKDKRISYKKTGSIYKMPKKLRSILIKMMQTSKKKLRNRSVWEKAPNGEIHDSCINYAIRDFKSGLTKQEVIKNGMDYVEKYLNGTPREVRLMLERIEWASQKIVEEKIEKVEKSEFSDQLTDEEIREVLLKAKSISAIEFERIKKALKKKFGYSLKTLDEMTKATAGNIDFKLGDLFKGQLIWDSELGIYAEVTDNKVVYFNKSNFTQTVLSISGYMKPSDVNELLCTIPKKRLIYDPTETIADSDTINLYRSVDYGNGSSKMPKTIKKVLKNLFVSSTKYERERFINWLAYIVQTGKRSGVAWGFFGASGTGKGLIVDVIMRILGKDNVSLNVGDTDLQSNFNPYIFNKQFVHLNEIASDFHGRHGVAGKIKGFVTDPYIRINQKGLPEISVDNYANIILNSNKPNPIELDLDDRRWNMIVTNISLASNTWWKGNRTYQTAIKESFQFARYLLKYNVNMQDAITPMKINSAKQSIIEQTTSDLELVGKAIKNLDLDRVLDLLALEDEFNITEKEIETALTTKQIPSNLLSRIYCYITAKENPRPLEYINYFIKPFITSNPSYIVKKNKASLRYYSLTD